MYGLIEINCFFFYTIATSALPLNEDLKIHTDAPQHSGINTAFIFTGRWEFLKIQFPYLFANLKGNGGVLDKIVYVMMNYKNDTHDNLVRLKNVVNRLSGQDILSMDYMGHPPGYVLPKGHPLHDGLYAAAYMNVLQDITQNPTNRYFKIDDDVIYIHPGTFENMIIRENTSCTIRFANIAGANWRCSYIHQTMGLYNDRNLNPNGLQFGFSPLADCGWHSAECAKLSLNTFLSLHKKQQLNRYLFDTVFLEDKRRFSINFFMISNRTINRKALAESLPIYNDDEEWWTVRYVQKIDPHCVVGSSLVVHFSYHTTINTLLKDTNLIKEFEHIAYGEHKNLPEDLREALQIH